MMSITKYDRLYKCNKTIDVNDVYDVLISAYIPYVDAVIMENHQVEVLKQNISKLERLKFVEKYALRDLLK